MKKQLISPLVVAFLFTTIITNIQAKPVTITDSTESALSYTVALEYGTNKTYNGRITTADNQHYFSPSLLITSRWGIYARADAYRLFGDSADWDQSDLSLGYKTKLGKYRLSASYTHSFFSSSSEQINSGLTDNIELYVKRPLLTVLRTKLAFDYSTGDTTDYSVTWQISYSVDWDDVFTADDNISLTPKLNLYYGTQNYYTRFYRLPKGQKVLLKKDKNAKNPPPKPAAKPAPADAQTAARFNMTGLLFTMPLNYTIGKFSFEMAPNYIVTINQPKYEPKTPNTLSFTFSISVDF